MNGKAYMDIQPRYYETPGVMNGKAYMDIQPGIMKPLVL